jgi:membrane protein required for colicin V production
VACYSAHQERYLRKRRGGMRYRPRPVKLQPVLIDIVFLIFVLGAVIKGLRRGLIVAVFSFLALVIGLAAAIKLSAVVANHLKDSVHLSAKWLPIVSFVLVFLAIVLLVRWLEGLVGSVIKFAFLGWVDKLGGVILYALVYLAIFSIILFYCTKAQVLSGSMIAASRTYSLIEPFGPLVINKLAILIPFFKDMFGQLEKFFGSFA